MSILVSQFRLLRPFGTHSKSSSRPFSAFAMASHKQSAIAAESSGVFEQETVSQEIPLSVTTPPRNNRQGRVNTAASQDTDALAATSGFSDSLAERIKSGNSRRKTTKTTKAKTDVGAAAVNALSDIIDAMIMPGQSATERYLDSRDADLNVPDDIPGASSEQVQRAKQPATRPDHTGPANGDASPSVPQSAVRTPEPKSRKPVAKRQGKGAKAAVLKTASELAQGPDVCEDKLQEDEKVRCSYCLLLTAVYNKLDCSAITHLPRVELYG